VYGEERIHAEEHKEEEFSVESKLSGSGEGAIRDKKGKEVEEGNLREHFRKKIEGKEGK